MPKHATDARERILDTAERLFLDRGFGGTSVDAIVEQTGVTKGAFFHHFPSKQDLARLLIERYTELDLAFLAQLLARAEALSRDPLQQVLILVGLYAERMEGLERPFPGCLFASYCYQAGLLEDEVNGLVGAGMARWRDAVAAKLEAAVAHRPPRLPADPVELADALLVVLEGAFVLSKTLNDPQVVARQLRQYRNYLELLFDVG